MIHTAGESVVNVAVANMNGDGIRDLVVTGKSDLSVLLGTGHGSFGAYRDQFRNRRNRRSHNSSPRRAAHVQRGATLAASLHKRDRAGQLYVDH